MATNNTSNTNTSNSSTKKNAAAFDAKDYSKSTNKDLKADHSFEGADLDQDTYGSTGSNTVSTGGGASGGVGANEDHAPRDMRSTDTLSSNVTDTAKGNYGNTNAGAKAGAGANGSRTVNDEVKADSASADASKDAARSTEKKSSLSDNASDIQDLIMKQINELGDLMERAGEKIENAGFSRIGDAIYRLGDRLEHLKGGKGQQDVKNDAKSATGKQAADSVKVDSGMDMLNTGTQAKSAKVNQDPSKSQAV